MRDLGGDNSTMPNSGSEDREKRRNPMKAPALPTVWDQDLASAISKSLSVRDNSPFRAVNVFENQPFSGHNHPSTSEEPLLDFFGNPIPRRVEPSCHSKYESHQALKKDPLPDRTELGVPPLNTLRLQPTRHKTKNAILTLLENGEVCIELLKRKGGSKNEERVIDVCRISSDGLRVAVYKVGRHGKGILVDNNPPPLPSSGADSIHSYECLPREHWKKYLYASRFISLVRAKTPKVTLYTSEAKCILMENSPDADFEANFYSGGKMTKCLEGFKAIDQEGIASVLHTDVIDTYSSSVRSMWLHFVNVHKHTLAVESALELTAIHSDGPVFPIIIGRRPLVNFGQAQNLAKENTSPNQLALGSFNLTSFKSSDSVKNSQHKVLSGISIPGVGHASKKSNGDIKIVYKDGTELIVNGDSAEGIIFKDVSGQKIKYNPSDRIDPLLRTKLAQVPTILRQFIPKQHSHIR